MQRGNQFARLFRIRRKGEHGAAVDKLLSNLRGAQRRVHRHRNSPGRKNRLIGNKPLKPILRQYSDSVAMLNTPIDQSERGRFNLLDKRLPRTIVIQAGAAETRERTWPISLGLLEQEFGKVSRRRHDST